jgi:hypothetical protein
MHELARHVIHSSEVLRVACKTLQRMVADQQRLCRENEVASPSGTSEDGGREPDGRTQRGPQKSLRQIANDLRYHAALIESLQQRSQSFDERLRNEIKLVRWQC